MSFAVALRKELLEQWRCYRLLCCVVILSVLGLASPLFAKLLPELIKQLQNGEEIARHLPPPSMADAVAQYLKNITQTGGMVALLMAMGAIAQEKARGTAALMLTKPMSRGAFVMAKFVAHAMTMAAGTLAAAAGCYYYTALLFGPPPLGAWVAVNALTLLYLLVYVALTILWSTLARSQLVAGGLAFGSWILLSALGAIPSVGKFLPGQLTTWAMALTQGACEPAWGAVGVSVAMMLAALVAAWAIFERQEL